MRSTKADAVSDNLDEPTFDRFAKEVEALLEDSARAKNYSARGVNGPNLLYQSIQEMTGGHAHGCGEIIYKVRRFLSSGARGGNVEDILKVAAWSFLIYRHAVLDPLAEEKEARSILQIDV